jgi:hypothetical protein
MRKLLPVVAMNSNLAMCWGRWLASYFRARGESNPFFLAAQWGWRMILETEAHHEVFAPERLAEWDGSRRTIRLFLPALHRFIGNSVTTLHHACAHELFHGLAALDYRPLPLAVGDFPILNHEEEEMAARVFAEALLS